MKALELEDCETGQEDKDKDEDEESRKPKKFYEVWEGNSRFLCGGRIVVGSQLRNAMATLVTMMATFGIFLSLVYVLASICFATECYSAFLSNSPALPRNVVFL